MDRYFGETSDASVISVDELKLKTGNKTYALPVDK